MAIFIPSVTLGVITHISDSYLHVKFSDFPSSWSIFVPLRVLSLLYEKDTEISSLNCLRLSDLEPSNLSLLIGPSRLLFSPLLCPFFFSLALSPWSHCCSGKIGRERNYSWALILSAGTGRRLCPPEQVTTMTSGRRQLLPRNHLSLKCWIITNGEIRTSQ